MLVSNSSLVSMASNESDYTISPTNSLENYTGSATNIVLPTEIGGQVVTWTYQTFRNNTSIKTVVVPEGYTKIGDSTFEGCSSLEKVTLPKTLEVIGSSAFKNCTALGTVGESIIIPSSVTKIMASAFNGCTNPDLVIDIRSTNTTAGLLAFKNVVGTIYVYSQNVYDAVKKRATSANVVLRTEIPTEPTDPPTPSLDYTNLNKALEDGEAVDTSMYTEATAKALEDAILSGKAVKDNTSATQTDVDNAVKAIEDAKKGLVYKPADYTAVEEAKAKVPADLSGYTQGTVDALNAALAAVVEGKNITEQTVVDSWAKAIEEAINGLVKKLNYTELDAAIKEAEGIISNNSDEYTAESIALLQSALDTAKVYRGMDESEMNQETVDYATDLVRGMIDALVKIDIEKFLNDLKAVIKEANALDESDYTDESYKELADAISAASKLNETSNYKDILAAQSNIKSAVDKLILKPLEEFVKIYKNGTVATITEGTADSKMNGATSVRVTFNCAPDVSYNPNAAIELKAVVSGTESYEKFMGKDSNYTNGANGWTETLALTNPISEGQSYEISAFTYAWNNAADYVYAVSKVEFLDAEGKVLSKVTANTIAMDELEKAIAEAKSCNPSEYTETSFAVLTTAIGVAEAITDKAEVADIKAATKAIEEAIAGLEEKIKTGNVSGTINVSDKNAETEITITAVSADETKEQISVTATSMGTYTIENLETGDYTLTISDGDKKYAVREYKVTITEGGITQDVSLNPYGDVNGDGKVTTADVGLANAHAKGVRTLEGYAFICANVCEKEVGVTTADVGDINSHAKGVRALW